MELEFDKRGLYNSGNNRAICMLNAVALFWALFQLFVASNIPEFLATSFHCSWIILNNFIIQSVHLLCALILAFSLSPIVHSSALKNGKIPIYDLVLVFLSIAVMVYGILLQEDIASRVMNPNFQDKFFSILGIIILLEAARRFVGLPIMLLSLAFLLYSRFGEYFPDAIAHKNFSIPAIASHQWFTYEGVFGVALNVSSSFIFLYVLFGGLLDKAGAGNFFIALSFSAFGKFKAGAAKASVVASGLMGMVSGSSIANTISVGTFTIPLMKKMGFSSEKAGAIEISSGVNGQLMPPIMGAAAFLMAENLGIPYLEIVKYAAIPAATVYIALLYMVHTEASKTLDQLPESSFQKCRFNLKKVLESVTKTALNFCVSAVSISFVVSIIYFLLSGFHFFGLHIPGLKDYFGSGNKSGVMALLSFMIPVDVAVVIYQANRYTHESISELLDLKSISTQLASGNLVSSSLEIFKAGVQHVLPVFVLLWCLIVERLSASMSCYWSIVYLLTTMLLNQLIFNIFWKSKSFAGCLKHFFRSVYEAMVGSSMNMVIVAIATATAGMIVGSVTLTGFGLSAGMLVDTVAQRSLLISLVITAASCIILGIGMPTTACYVVVSSLIIPTLLGVLQHLNYVQISPVSLHLFVFYFGLLADVTPPIGLAIYSACVISGGDPVKTGTQAFMYNMRTIVIPFAFVFNNNLILYGVRSIYDVLFGFITSIIGILAFSNATQNYLITKSRLYESLLVMIASMILLFPGSFLANFFGASTNLPPIVLNTQMKFDSDSIVRFYISKNSFYALDHQSVIEIPIYKDKNVLSISSISKYLPNLKIKYENLHYYVTGGEYKSKRLLLAMIREDKHFLLEQMAFCSLALMIIAVVFYSQYKRIKYIS